MKILPVILSGGFGTRLWPLSRQMMPKQFLNDLFGAETLFHKALKLVSNKEIFLPPLCVTHQDHKFFALQEYKSLGLEPDFIILEPCSKNTAIAIMAAAIKAKEIYGEEIILLILPSDHLIEPRELFEESIKNALEIAENKIVTFGIKPDFAATGYGYIKKSANISANCFAIDKFIEKPHQQKAAEFLADGNYLWNAGIFLLKAGLYLNEADKYLPTQAQIARGAMANSSKDGVFCVINIDDYEKAEDISIDYGILEKSSNIATTIMKARWSDVGDFNAVYQAGQKDQNQNVKKGNVELYNTSNSLIHSHNSLITCLGLKDIIVVETGDTILVADKNQSQEIKTVVKDLLGKNKNEIKLHSRVFRPWGYYETITCESTFKVKRILVNCGSSLSLQMHNHRSEHWVVIKGIATVQKDEEIFELEAGKSTFIPVKTKHRLANKQNQPLEIIEVQMGDYVEEDDIIRFEDNYGRK
jgi:mannose-1-phosphate guanylyltransferase/mannose-6-phosphate isomerase